MITKKTLVFLTKYQILTTVIFTLAPFQKQAPTLAHTKKEIFLNEIALNPTSPPLPSPLTFLPISFLNNEDTFFFF